MIESQIFKKSFPDFNKLLHYGFIYEKDKYIYEKKILDDAFKIVVWIFSDYRVVGHVFDLESDCEYINFRVEGNIGEFAGNVRNIFEDTLCDIKNNCFVIEQFNSSQANRISKELYDIFGDSPYFEWESTPDAGVFKNKNTKKWYALIMNISKDKIGKGNDKVDIINIKLDPHKILKLIDNKSFFPAYHMNKKYWITICLDDSVKDSIIIDLIKESYSYSCGKNSLNTTNEWIIPANPKYYDIETAFSNNNIISWKQSNNINVGDIVYLYVGAPISSIKYKCIVRKNNIPYEYVDSNLKINNVMEIELIDKYDDGLYSFSLLNEYGVNAVRGPRSMPIYLSKFINKDCGGSDVGENK